MQHGEQRFQHLVVVGVVLGNRGRTLQQLDRVALADSLQQAEDQHLAGRAQQGLHGALAHLTFAVSDGLIEQGQRIAHAALGGAGQMPKGGFLKIDLLGNQHRLQVGHDLLGHEVLQIELQAARQDGDRQLLRVGGSEQELDVGRRLLKRLEQRVETVGGQHVDLIDEVHLVSAA